MDEAQLPAKFSPKYCCVMVHLYQTTISETKFRLRAGKAGFRRHCCPGRVDMCCSSIRDDVEKCF
jgi:hypothetical protein